eukprot:4992106-Amphidinium_carterae.1
MESHIRYSPTLNTLAQAMSRVNAAQGLTILRNTLLHLVGGMANPWTRKCVEQLLLENSPARQLRLCSNVTELAVVAGSHADDSMWDEQHHHSVAVTGKSSASAGAPTGTLTSVAGDEIAKALKQLQDLEARLRDAETKAEMTVQGLHEVHQRLHNTENCCALLSRILHTSDETKRALQHVVARMPPGCRLPAIRSPRAGYRQHLGHLDDLGTNIGELESAEEAAPDVILVVGMTAAVGGPRCNAMFGCLILSPVASDVLFMTAPTA